MKDVKWSDCSLWELVCWYEMFDTYRRVSRYERRRSFMAGDLDRGARAGKMVRTFASICDMIIAEMKRR